MQLIALTTVLLSALGANAAALDKPADWQVTDWSIRGSPGGSAYGFNISAAATRNTPGFETECKGIPGNLTSCADRHISAKVTERETPNWNIFVQHRWGSQNDGHAVSGSVNASQFSKTRSYTIKPSTFLGAN